MPQMWRGPSAAMKRAESDPLWTVLHRRNAKLGVFCAFEGDTAQFYTISRRRDGDYSRHDIGESRGADPMLAVLHGSRQYVGFDTELLAHHYAYLDGIVEDVVLDGRSVVTRLSAAADAFLA